MDSPLGDNKWRVKKLIYYGITFVSVSNNYDFNDLIKHWSEKTKCRHQYNSPTLKKLTVATGVQLNLCIKYYQTGFHATRQANPMGTDKSITISIDRFERPLFLLNRYLYVKTLLYVGRLCVYYLPFQSHLL